MFIITILAMLVTLAGVTLSITGFTVTNPVAAQMTSDNATMSGNMTSGNATGSNTTGSISSLGEDGGGTVSTDDSEGGCIDCSSPFSRVIVFIVSHFSHLAR